MLISLSIFGMMFNVVLTRRYLSLNSFEVDNLTRRASVNVNGCSGTLISSNIVYTAAHCLYDKHVSSLVVFHPSDPTKHYRAKDMYFPADFIKGMDFYKNPQNCGTRDCNNECVNNNQWGLFYYMKLDYGLVLLEEHMPVCEHPEGPVAAVVDFPVYPIGSTTVPTEKGIECFLAGYGLTDNTTLQGGLNMAVINSIVGVEDVSAMCSLKAKGFYTRFFNSHDTNGYTTTVCPGDSGAGIQCISDGGKRIAVIGVHAKSVPTTNSQTPISDGFKYCTEPHESFALAASEHGHDLYAKMEEWNEKQNFDQIFHKCANFLMEHPFKSVMENYLNMPSAI